VSTVVAIAYRDRDTAVRVMETLAGLQKRGEIRLEDAVIAERRGDGSIAVDQGINALKRGATHGLIWGGIIGTAFLVPIAGLALGAAAGAIEGAIRDYGLDDDFVEKTSAALKPGGAAVFLLVAKAKPEPVIAALRPFGGILIQSSLSPEAEAMLRVKLEDI
jgi:uncharacterized membrane protein